MGTNIEYLDVMTKKARGRNTCLNLRVFSFFYTKMKELDEFVKPLMETSYVLGSTEVTLLISAVKSSLQNKI